jgi:hypothetical protein
MDRYLLTFPQAFVGFFGTVVGFIMGNAVGGSNYLVMVAGAILGFGVGAGLVYMLGGGPGGESVEGGAPVAVRDIGGGGSE